MRNKIIVDIDWDQNFGAGSERVLGCVATANTLEGVKAAYRSALEFHVGGMMEDGDEIPRELSGDYELVFRLSTNALLKYYSQFISLAAISRATGINQRQLSHYLNGIRNPRPAQRDKIIAGLKAIGRELLKAG